MSAAIRLVRALRVFAVIFLSYLWQVSWAKLWPKRFDSKAHWSKVNRRNARRMYRGFVSLRGVYIKLGQILSVMGTFLPKEYTQELEALQDDVPPASYKTIRSTFVKSFKKPPEQVFKTFEQVPIAAASLGQVHLATNEAGEKLAVKILYPNVATIIKVDLKVLGWALKIYRNFVPIAQIERVHEQLSDMLERETDLANEARCLERMSNNFKDDDDVLFPTVYPEFSSGTVMTMSFMDGVKITKQDALSKLQLDPMDVATKLTKVFYKQLFLDKFFHADPHPGNFFVQRGPQGQPRIVVLDLGSATPLTNNLADGMFDILSGLMTRNDDLVVKGIDTMGFIAANGDRAFLEQTIRKYFEKLLNLEIADFSKIDPAVAHQLADPDMKRDELRHLMQAIAYPEGWFYVERAAVIMFGLQTTLAPKLNGIQIGFPYVTQFIMEKNQKRFAEAAATQAQAAATAVVSATPATAAAAATAAALAEPERERAHSAAVDGTTVTTPGAASTTAAPAGEGRRSSAVDIKAAGGDEHEALLN